MLLALLVGLLPAASALGVELIVQNGQGQPITGGFKFLVEEDNTNWTSPGQLTASSISLDIHTSYAPVVVQGDSAGASNVTVPLDSSKRYYVTVLPNNPNLGAPNFADGWAMGGVAVPVGATQVTAVVHRYPIPTAQISITVFNDNGPINNAQDAGEQGLENFEVIIADDAGPLSQDVFGNPLGTTYLLDADGRPQRSADGTPIVDVLGTGLVLTDAAGRALVKYLAPGKFGVKIAPPTDQPKWVQTATIEGTHTIDAWVKANEPPLFVEGFGTGFAHVSFGFVDPTALPWAITPPGGTATIRGKVVQSHFQRPPGLTGMFPGPPLSEAWVGLNSGAGATGLWASRVDPLTNQFAITGVPAGTYQLVTWDGPLISLFGFNNVTVADGQVLDLGDVKAHMWFGVLEGRIFQDLNLNGFDDNEPGLANLAVNIRFRDGSMYLTQPTDPSGEYKFDTVFPFFKWLIAEVDFSRFKATGMTSVTDAGGQIDLVNTAFPGDGVRVPLVYPDGNAGGWRTETGPVLTQAMQLYLGQNTRIDWGKTNYGPNENGGISGIVFYATTRAEDNPRFAVGETWEPGVPRVQVSLYQDDGTGTIVDLDGNRQLEPADVDNFPFGWAGGLARGAEDVDRDGDGVFDVGDSLQVVTTDSWDDNLPSGCVQPLPAPHGVPAAECFDNFGTWNQTRPGVFDGGYAFNNLPRGRYIVRVDPPPPYEIQKEEDKNVEGGDVYLPLAPCVGALHVIPGTVPPVSTPLCDMKQVALSDGQNGATDFFIFTQVPKAARGVGFVNNDLTAEFNAVSPIFGEKASPSWIPISVQDWAGNEVNRVYTDEWGSYNFLVTSTSTPSIPAPSGMAPAMYTVMLNHPFMKDPNNPGQFIEDPWYNPDYSQMSWTFNYMPGKTSYLDTPIVPVAAFVGYPNGTLDTEPADGTPVLKIVEGSDGTYQGPIVCSAGQTVRLTSMGPTQVPNPLYLPGNGQPQMITRDFGFGATQGTVTANGAALPVNSWSSSQVVVTVPAGVSTGQLLLRRGDNNRTTEIGITLHVGCSNVREVAPAPYPATPIQDAIDAASPGALILIAPGVYNESPIVTKKVKLQGFGAGSTFLYGGPYPAERVVAWRDRMNALLGVPNPFIAQEMPVITVVPPAGAFTASNPARIDGLQLTGSVSGGGIFVNDFGNYLQITNNRIKGNQGNYGGGVIVGFPAAGASNANVTIRHNYITKNGGIQGGGGVVLNAGSHNYQVRDNFIAGNFGRFSGGGIAHSGLSNQGLIARNRIVFNEVFYGLAITGAGDGAGIYVAGDLVPNGIGDGAGSVTIDGNLIMGNLNGSGYGGGIRAIAFNGTDASGPNSGYELKIFNNIIANNVAGTAGGGIALQDVVNGKIVHNTITNNDATATSAASFTPGSLVSTPQVAGLLVEALSPVMQGVVGATFVSPLIASNIIHSNRAYFYDHGANPPLQPAPQQFIDLGVSGAGVPAPLLSPRFCLLADASPFPPALGNVAGNPGFVAPLANSLLSGLVMDEGGNNISVRFHPYLVAGADYHINATSPAVYRGDNTTFTLYPELQRDFDLENRTSAVDIGADERPGTNRPPLAINDTASTRINTPITINVLGNDSDPEGQLDPTSVMIVVEPTQGTAVVNAGGTIRYTPPAGYTGTVRFNYTVRDLQGATSLQALVTVQVWDVDVLTVTRADFRVATQQWDIRGRATVTTDNTVTVRFSNAAGLGGAVIGTATVRSDGTWLLSRRATPSTTPNPLVNNYINGVSKAGGVFQGVLVTLR
ncbi:MAG: Ig-like domain-containing protein [Thermoanaerobaculaceae bacterium]